MIILSDSYYTEKLEQQEFYSTKLTEHSDGTYRLSQDQQPMSTSPLPGAIDFVMLTKEQAIDIARTILRNEGITCLV